MIQTRKTALSVTYADGDGVEQHVREVAAADVETFAFDAGEAITGATATLTLLGAMDDATALITNTEVATPTVDVTVAGLTRGGTYELAVVMENAAGRAWTRTLTIRCVA